jgi:hypothetical protein
MGSQKQIIDDSSIEHSNIQQVQAEQDAISFQNSHDNIGIIKRIIYNISLFSGGATDSPQLDLAVGMILLKDQRAEIRKRLLDTLGNNANILIDVTTEEQPQWVNRPSLQADLTLQIDGKNFGTLDSNQMLIETFGRGDINGKLLILGAPGAGKTTALLSLAEQLVEGAISGSGRVIPVLFELSTWQDDGKSIHSWLIDRLCSLHQGDRKIYEKWLDQKILLPLLDGLDELGLERQKKCTDKLNEFASYYPQIVVCCRAREFETVNIKLRNLRGAVCIQPLSDSQIERYLLNLNRPKLWTSIQSNLSLQFFQESITNDDISLLRTPLFINLLVDSYSDSKQVISSKTDLLDKYIDRQLSVDKRDRDRRKELNESKWAYKNIKLEPDRKKTIKTLKWVAQNLDDKNKIELLIEEIQPSWIESTRLKYRYHLTFGLILGLIFGLIPGIETTKLVVYSFVDWRIAWLVAGIIYGIIYSFIYRFVDELMHRSQLGLLYKLIFWIAFGLTLRILISATLSIFASLDLIDTKNLWIGDIRIWSLLGLCFGLDFNIIGSSIKIEPVERFQLSISSIKRQEILFNLKGGLIYGIVYGILSIIIWFLTYNKLGSVFEIASSLIYYILLGIICGLINSLKQESNIKSCPNQGIRQSFQNQIYITIFIFLFSISFSIISNLFNHFIDKNIPVATLFDWFAYSYLFLPSALFIGVLIGGGKAVIQHISLRIILWQSGLPWNFASFLKYCVERRLLLHIGGRYRFLHRELLDHFANLK